MNRRNEILVVALVLQVVLIVLLTTLRTPASSAATAGKPLFDNVKTADVAQLNVQDTTGKSIALTKKGSDWVMPSAEDFPADTVKVTTFLDKVLKVQSGRLVAQTASSYARLQVADDNYVRRVAFQTGNGITHTLLIGTSPAGSSVHVRADGLAEVYLTDSLSSADAGTDAATWINTSYITATQDNVTNFTLSNPNGLFDFTKSVSNTWKLNGLQIGETFDSAKLTDMLSRVTLLNMQSPLGKTIKPEYGLQSPAATITLTLKQAGTSTRPIVLHIGAKDSASNTYAVNSTESPYVVQVSSLTLDDFVTRKRQDFLVPPPTPSAAPGVTGPISPTLAPTQ